jgi:hypothetical protein
LSEVLAPHARYDWSRLNHLQVGKYAEYFVKMEFTLHGFEVYTSEVDDRGIDFVVRTSAGRYYDAQVKSVRGLQYVFLRKDKFILRDNLLACLVLLTPGMMPDLFLIPAETWRTPTDLFCDRPYGPPLKSSPEWGLNISSKNLPLLEPFRFDAVVTTL